MNRHPFAALLLVFLAVAATACGQGHHESALSRFENATSSDTPSAALAEIDAQSFERIRSVDSVVVRWESSPAFAVQTRRGALENYPCENCHRGVEPPLPADMAAGGVARGETFAHGKIELRHAPGAVMKCETCHDRRNRSRFVTTTGETVAFDRAHELCRSCHFRQFADWVGGAHGKRQANWAGPRLVAPCVSCHNPHAPAIGPRWPVAYPRLDRRNPS